MKRGPSDHEEEEDGKESIMSEQLKCDECAERLYLAGEHVPPERSIKP